ncbi:MAG: flagellar basal body P-ring formation chaperone FlgA [Planctomycetota bacterium]
MSFIKPALIAIATLCLVASSSIAAEIVLRDRLSTSGSVVRLGEIASVGGLSPAAAERLGRSPIMPAPAPGTMQIVRAEEIRDLLVAQGMTATDLRFAGAARILVSSPADEEAASASTPAGSDSVPMLMTPDILERPLASLRPAPQQQTGYRLVSEAPPRRPRFRRQPTDSELDKLKANLQEAINAYLRETTGEANLQALSLDLLSRNASSLAQAQGPIRVAMTGEPAIGRQRFLVSFTTADGPVRFPVYSEVQVATPVVVASRPIARGATITAADVRLMPLAEGQRLRGNELAMASVDEAIGKEAGRSIRPGQPLTDANCLAPMMVRRGELVEVIAGGGGVRIRRTLKARVDGRLGETIEVETMEDKQRLQARVVGYRELAVVAAGGGSNGYLGSLSNGRSFR